MATLREIIDSFDNYIETSNGLNITCIKGFPDFRQLNLNPPIAALFYTGSGVLADSVRRRIGAATTGLELTLGVYATDEVNLFALAALVQAMRMRQPITLSAGSDAKPVKVYIGEDTRDLPGPDDPKELRHFFTVPVVLAYEG